MAWTDPQTWTPGMTVDEDDLNTYVRDNQDWLYDNLPLRATMWHSDSSVSVGNAIGVTVTASQYFNHIANQTSPSDGDEFTQSCVLAEGTYTLYVLGMLNTDQGIIDWDLDGTTIKTGQDWYGGSAVYNTLQAVFSVVVGAGDGGRHVLTGTVNGKHASSSDYAIRITKLYFIPVTE